MFGKKEIAEFPDMRAMIGMFFCRELTKVSDMLPGTGRDSGITRTGKYAKSGV